MPRKTFSDLHAEISARYPSGQTAGGVSVDDIVQLRLQNTWDTHLDIAREMAVVMRADMAAYDADASKFTQSLGCWSGFHAQQMIKAVKRMRGTAKGTYVYLSGWMVAGLRNRWGHLPDQSMHEKTAVADLIEEIYTSLRQADEVAAEGGALQPVDLVGFLGHRRGGVDADDRQPLRAEGRGRGQSRDAAARDQDIGAVHGRPPCRHHAFAFRAMVYPCAQVKARRQNAHAFWVQGRVIQMKNTNITGTSASAASVRTARPQTCTPKTSARMITGSA